MSVDSCRLFLQVRRTLWSSLPDRAQTVKYQPFKVGMLCRQKTQSSHLKIKNIHFLFSSYFENISTCYLPCEVSSQNSYGKCHYFNFTFLIRLAAITQFKNDRDRTLRVGSSWPKDFVTSMTQHVQFWLCCLYPGEYFKLEFSYLVCSARRFLFARF